MQTTLSQFCNECGALVAEQAILCAVCGKSTHTLRPSPPVPVAALPAACVTAGTTAESLRPGALFVQRYRILDKVGEGGFGVTYKAEDLEQHRRFVAIKQINLRLLRIEATDSFNREVGYLSRLKHDDVPRIYDYFTDADHWYVVMDYIAGETLEDKLKKVRRGRFSTQKVLDIGIALCDVLGHLHAQQPPIVFRDVKPANIMLTKVGRIYLIDFGIARHYAPGQSRDTAPLGSPGYAAPEQYGKAQTTAQTDIYGLGVTLQTLLTGKEPLEIVTSGEKQGRKIKRRVPRRLRPLLQQMLERDASQRPQSMEEVKEHLQRFSYRPRMQKVRRTLIAMRKATVDAFLLTLLAAECLLYTGILRPLLIVLIYVLVCVIATLLRLRKGWL
jgi:serine/threonine protein kinase